jgi:acyl carrier protein
MSSVTPTERKLQDLVGERLRMPPDEVPLDKSLLEDLGLDSLTIVTILVEVDEVFAPVSVSDQSFEDLRTLREIAAFIDREQAAG